MFYLIFLFRAVSAADDDHRLVSNAESSWRRVESRLKPCIKKWLEDHWTEDEQFNMSVDLSHTTSVDL